MRNVGGLLCQAFFVKGMITFRHEAFVNALHITILQLVLCMHLSVALQFQLRFVAGMVCRKKYYSDEPPVCIWQVNKSWVIASINH